MYMGNGESRRMSVLEYLEKTQNKNLTRNCDSVVEYEEAKKDIEFYIFELSNTKIKKSYI